MDEFLRDIQTSIFKEWLYMQEIRHVVIYYEDDDENTLHYESDYAHGTINFGELDIIGMTIINTKTQDPVFFLHFQMQNFAHALSLYYEFLDTLKQQEEKKGFRLMLCCTGGLTTGYFADSLNNMAMERNMDCSFDALPVDDIYTEALDYDAILLAPQISYRLAEVRAVFSDKFVQTIPPKIFGSYDVEGMLSLVDQELQKNIRRQQRFKRLQIRKDIVNPTKILVIAVLRHVDHTVIAYALYDHNDLILTGDFIKPKFKMIDIKDVLNTVFAMHNDVEMVGIAIPGIINNGILDLNSEGFDHDDLNLYFKDYPQTFIFSNDVNAIAVGIYASQEDYETLSFVFHPRGSLKDGIGTVIDNKLWTGHKNLAGEAQYLDLGYDDHEANPKQTLSGALTYTTKEARAIIAMIAPEAIFYYNDLIPDPDTLKQKLAERIPPDYLPDIKKISHMKEYALLGEMLLCISARETTKNIS